MESLPPQEWDGLYSRNVLSYLADHLLKEQTGGGSDSWLNTLQKYADYVSGGKDFVLTQFISRHSPSSKISRVTRQSINRRTQAGRTRAGPQN
jgi:hypothetical protein